MKSILWMVCGLCAAVLGFLVWNSRGALPVQLLASRFERAWSDHRTVVETV